MIFTPPTMTIPLQQDEHGAIRVGRTRVLLELVIHRMTEARVPSYQFN